MNRPGKTTAAMRAAPANAIYVWVNGHLHYPKMLARMLGRDDLKIVSPAWLELRLRARTEPLVVDHAAHLSEWQLGEVLAHRDRIARIMTTRKTFEIASQEQEAK